MKLIELTQYDSQELRNGSPILVNLEKVSTIEPDAHCTRIALTAGAVEVVRESYDEVLKRISEVNDKQFCLIRRPEKPKKSHDCKKPYHEQKIVNADAIYTGGGVWVFMGELESGKFFMAFEENCYEVMVLDADPRKAEDMAYYQSWQESHTVWDYVDSLETEETLGMFRRIYNATNADEFIYKETHIDDLNNYERFLRKKGEL
jgi:uncharacterized protein YlzI (FlbEa/FlbD family)